jgi:hypothetical protein
MFNFHYYYEEPQRMELDKLEKEVTKRISYIWSMIDYILMQYKEYSASIRPLL